MFGTEGVRPFRNRTFIPVHGDLPLAAVRGQQQCSRIAQRAGKFLKYRPGIRAHTPNGSSGDPGVRGNIRHCARNRYTTGPDDRDLMR